MVHIIMTKQDRLDHSETEWLILDVSETPEINAKLTSSKTDG